MSKFCKHSVIFFAKKLKMAPKLLTRITSTGIFIHVSLLLCYQVLKKQQRATTVCVYMKDAQAAVCSNLPFFSPLLLPPDLLASFFSPVVVASAASFLPSFRHIFRYGAMLAHISRITISAHASVGYAVWQEHNQDMAGSVFLYRTVKRPALNQVPAPSKFPYVVCKLKGPPAIKKVGAIDPPTHPRCVHSGGGRKERRPPPEVQNFNFIQISSSIPHDQPSGKRVGGGGRNFLSSSVYISFPLCVYRMERTPGVFDWNYNGE